MKLCAKSEAPDYNIERERQRNLAGAVNVTYKKKIQKLTFPKRNSRKVKKKKVTLVRSTSRTLHHRSDCQQPSPTGQHTQRKVVVFLPFATIPSRKAPTSTEHRWLGQNVPLRSCPGTQHLCTRKTSPRTTVSSRYTNKTD